MENYVVNKFISIIKVGFQKYYIKHGVLSNKSYVLDLEAKKDKQAVFIDQLMESGKVDIANLANEEQQNETVNELVTFLLQEKIIVPEHSQNLEQYYSLINSFGDNGKIQDQKLLFVTSSLFLQKQIESNLKDVNIKFSFATAEQLPTINTEEYSLLSVIYENFSPDIFHKINQFSIENKVPLQISYLDGSTSYVSPIFIKNIAVCYNEMEIQVESSLTHKYEYLAYKRFKKAKPPLPPFLFNQILFYSLHLAFDFLITKKLKTKDRAIIFDLESLRYDLVDILPLPNCPACKSQNKMSHDFL